MASRIHKLALTAVIVGGLCGVAPSARAQWAVVDAQALVQLSQQLQQMKKMFETAKQTYGELQSLRASIGDAGPLHRPIFYSSGNLYQRLLNGALIPALKSWSQGGQAAPPQNADIGQNRQYFMSTMTLNSGDMKTGNASAAKVQHLTRSRSERQLLAALNGSAVAASSQATLATGLAQAKTISDKGASETKLREQIKVLTDGIAALIAEQVNNRMVNTALLDLMAADITTRARPQIIEDEENTQ